MKNGEKTREGPYGFAITEEDLKRPLFVKLNGFTSAYEDMFTALE